jgi:hypothetical protein
MKNSIKILEAHNSWRRGYESAQGNPSEIGIAIDDCLQAAKRYEMLRTFRVNEFRDVYVRTLCGEHFDEIIDELIKEREA